MPKLGRLELRIMQVLWVCGELSIKQIRGSLCLDEYCTYENVQTTIYGLERKNAVCRVDKIKLADIFEATVTREAAYGRLVDDFYRDFLEVFGGRPARILVHLVEAGALTIDELKQAGQAIHSLQRLQMLMRQEDARRR
jgi:BlaI family transcriptional regulator, penicillinase repressor